jgi:hypothetical protein
MQHCVAGNDLLCPIFVWLIHVEQSNQFVYVAVNAFSFILNSQQQI